MPFAALGLSAELVRAAHDHDYVQPTAIQASAIPLVLQGDDLIACAQTGSGKTAAFVLPLLQQHLQWRAQIRDMDVDLRPKQRVVQSLILVPTRELAMQVSETLRGLAKRLPEQAKMVAVYGGVSINPQMMNLRGGADIVIATPGRLIDLIEQRALSIAGVKTLVLDEADRLLDLGFSDELNRILDLLPQRRQSLFFSATFSPAVEALAAQLLTNPQRVEIAATPIAAPDILQRAIDVDESARTQLLRHLIIEHGWSRVLVFVATQYAAEHVAKKLNRAGIKAAAFHGSFEQGKRSQVISDFKASRLQVVVATDLAARGIDIAQLPAVVNYDLPRSTTDYTHRIGRTGRAGESGVAVSFVTSDFAAHFRLIEKQQNCRVPREQITGFEPKQVNAVAPEATVSPNNGGIKGRRKSKKDKLREAAALAAAEQKTAD
ncbi:DEAD/DEAH box helicase [Chitinibacter bivalviorum]|uniref:DEAD/DEAH box helicase n=1 Tax=Chitinibacter bivalviorum TaxID=2739434 RepID=A0A7H9BI89_9NEIS|nr:DEAD/DEAH box helicase [Chitinibacter bivalviorum]QLG88440.1 DEAD/DEAH box helicase [Chitinibacter bivalviorum]